MIKLARIGYAPAGAEVVIDITVKNNPGHVLSPTWEMVLGLQRDEMMWDEYREAYLELLRKRWREGRAKELLKLAYETTFNTVVLVCFCKEESRCHRSIAKEVIEKIAAAYS